MKSVTENLFEPEPTTEPTHGIEVWDLPLRLFHWSMVAVVVVAGITGFAAPAWWLDVHIVAGFALGWLLVFRLAWGVLGSHFSKFGSFPLAPRLAVDSVRALFANWAGAHSGPGPLGHNPLGAWMIVALLSALATLVMTGVIVLGGQEKLGPLAFLVDFRTGRAALEVHEFVAWGLLGLVGVHVLGVFVDVRVLRHPALSAMITGKKSVTEPPAICRRRRHGLRGAIVFAISGVALLGGGGWLASIPAQGWHAIEPPAAFTVECGDCHTPHHPSLRSAQSWRAIMAGLSAHYGEDASLDAPTQARIARFLTVNAAETFDTEAAWRIGRADTPSLRMTDTRYWKKRHAGIDARVFKARDVGSKLNCNACHGDAASGWFADHEIHLPNGEKNDPTHSRFRFPFRID